MLLFGTKARDVFKAWAKKDKQAQIEGTKRLGLPENNTAADRAKSMGFGDETWYHGTNKDFNEFKNVGGRGVYVAENPSMANAYGTGEGGVVLPLKVKDANAVTDYVNVSNEAHIRSPLAHFNPKYAGVGAGSVMSADLMAEENKPTESIWSSLMNTIGNVNQQQAQGTADIGAGAIEGTAGIAKMLATQPDLVAEVAGGGLLKAAGVVSPWIKGAGLGGVLYPSELQDGTLRDENGEYHPHVAQLKKEQQLDEYIASLTPDIHSTEIKLGR